MANQGLDIGQTVVGPFGTKLAGETIAPSFFGFGAEQVFGFEALFTGKHLGAFAHQHHVMKFFHHFAGHTNRVANAFDGTDTARP